MNFAEVRQYIHAVMSDKLLPAADTYGATSVERMIGHGED
jgi:hypothetical protein